MTFVENGRPNPDDKETILNAHISAAEEAFGREFNPSEVSVIRAFYDPTAEYLAQQQQDIAQVLNSAQIDHAGGEALDLLAALIGITRLTAEPSTAQLQFRHDNPVTRNYTIPAGTRTQTESADPVRFETNDPVTMYFLDGFESGNVEDYTGDTGDFSVQQTTVYDGDNALTVDGTDSHIINIEDQVDVGSRLHSRIYLEPGTAAGFLFGVEDASNYYRASVDSSAGSVSLDVVEGGTSTTIESGTITVPEDEWLHLQTDWDSEGNHAVTLFDSTETELISVEAVEEITTYVSGGYGVSSEDTSGTKYFDGLSTSRVSIDATSLTDGAEMNVGSDSVVVMSAPVSGADEVTNPSPSSGGRDEESDDDFRERAKQELSSSVRASLPALVGRLTSMDETRTVTVVDNDTNSEDNDGRPGHSFEAVVDVDSDFYEDVAQTILDTKAVGDTSVGGHAGTEVTRTLTLVNDQEKEIAFSVPDQIGIYVTIELTKTDSYSGDNAVLDNIVQYAGGTLLSGGNVDGELEAGDDVVYNQIVEAVMEVAGVHDITSLDIGTSANPSGSGNITISDTETANAIATDDSLDITSSDV